MFGKSPGTKLSRLFSRVIVLEAKTGNIDSLVETQVSNYLRENPPTGYTHPSTHPATIIEQDSTHRFATDTEKQSWNGKQDSLAFTPVADDDARLSDARTPITHNHPASQITDAVVLTNDARLSDARTPTAHTHETPTWTSGITTKNITDASIVQNIAHGLGRVPKYVRIDGAIIITTAITQLATGIFDGTNNRGLTVAVGEGTSTAATDAVYTSTSIALGFSPLVATNVFTGANRQTGVISVDATNIIITWTKTGTVGSLTASLIWQCT